MQKLLAIVAAAAVYMVAVMASVRAAAQSSLEAEPPDNAAVSSAPSAPESGETAELDVSVTADKPAEPEEEPVPAPLPVPESRPEIQKEPVRYLPGVPLSRDLQTFTYDLCEELDIPYSLVLGVMEVESNFHTEALRTGGPADMVGLMQINSKYLPAHYKKYGVDNAYEPKDNITIGVNMLAESIRKNGVNYGLMEYNMGIVNMRKKRDKGIASTGYTRKVLQAKEAYDKQIQALQA